MRTHASPGRRRPTTVVSLLLVTVGLAVGASACGSTDDRTSATTDTPTCTTADRTLDSTAPPMGTTIPPISSPNTGVSTDVATDVATEAANTGTFTFDVVCQRFGNCHCDAALAEPLTATISFDERAMTMTNDEGRISYPRQPDGSFQLVLDEDTAKVATIHVTASGFVFDLTVNGAPCSTQIYTRR